MLINKYGKKCHPEFVNSDGETALIIVSKNCNIDLFIKLIEICDSYCNVSVADKTGNTAFMYVCKYFPSYCLKMLQIYGDELNIKHSNKDGQNASMRLIVDGVNKIYKVIHH